MSTFDDSSFEMHDDSFTPDTAERLLEGEMTSPEFADLAAMIADVRSTTSATATPEVRGALAEYVGVGLTATEAPAEPSASAAVSESIDLTAASQPRRRSVIAEVVTFAGTLSGKLLLGGAVAAASVTGAQAAGVVDLPGLPDKPATTVVVTDEVPAELPLEEIADEPETVETVEDSDPVEDLSDQEQIEPDRAEEEKAEADKAEEEAAKADDDIEQPAQDDKVEEPKAEEPKAEEPKVEEPKPEDTSDKPTNEEAIAALQAQLSIDKEAVYAAASAQIQPLEAEKKPLVEALNSTLAQLETARNDAKAPLYAELETTTDEQRKAEIEAELSAIFEQWEIDRDAAKAAAGPAITAIELQLENIEIARDAEISRLLEEYQAAVDALNK